MQVRCSPRVPVHYPANVHSDSGPGEAILFDLSATGCRIQSTIALTPGNYLALDIAASETAPPLAVEVSIVRWCRDNQIGVEFLRYAQGDRERVSNLVHDHEAALAISNPVEQEDLALSVAA